MRFSMNTTTCVLAIAGVLDLGTGVHADIINVPGDQPTIQAAIDAAVDGDEVVVAPGTYNERINFNGKAITVRSSDGPENTIIDAERGGKVVTLTSGEGPDSLLAGFTITGGFSSGFAGGVSCGNTSNPTIENCIISENVGTFGGGMSVSTAGATVTDCIFRSNTARFGSGLYGAGDGTLIARCVFRDNIALERGGGMDFNSEVTVVDTIFVGNSVIGAGGAVRVAAFGIATFSGCIFSDNLSSGAAGGLYNEGSRALVNCLFIDNKANTACGGVLNTFGSTASTTGCTFIGNTSVWDGGAIRNESTSSTSITASLFCDNVPDDIYGPYDDGGGNQFPDDCPATGACCLNEFCIALRQTDCDALDGTYQGDDADCEAAECIGECPADLSGDGEVEAYDLAILLGAWGACPK